MNLKTTPALPTPISLWEVPCLGSIVLWEGLWGDVGVEEAKEVTVLVW